MPIQRKNFINTFDEAQMLVKLCTENQFFRDRLLSLLNLPFENRQKILQAWMESLRNETVLQAELISALEFLSNPEHVDEIIQELEKLNGR